MQDVIGHAGQKGTNLFQCFRLAAAHRRQRTLDRARLHTGYRCIDKTNAALGQLDREVAGFQIIHGAGIDNNLPFAHQRCNALHTE